jgi:hypothetical protein
LHKAFLRWHDPDNWPLLREALVAMGRADLIGDGPLQLIPTEQPEPARQADSRPKRSATRPAGKGTLLTQHTGLPPRSGDRASHRGRKKAGARGGRRRSMRD